MQNQSKDIAWLLDHPKLVAYGETILGAVAILVCCGFFVSLNESRQVLATSNFEVSVGKLDRYRFFMSRGRLPARYEGHFVLNQTTYYVSVPARDRNIVETVIPSNTSISCVHLKPEFRPKRTDSPIHCFGLSGNMTELVSASSTIDDEKFANGMLQVLAAVVMIIGLWLTFSGANQIRNFSNK